MKTIMGFIFTEVAPCTQSQYITLNIDFIKICDFRTVNMWSKSRKNNYKV
jgi:hypothetical protein